MCFAFTIYQSYKRISNRVSEARFTAEAGNRRDRRHRGYISLYVEAELKADYIWNCAMEDKGRHFKQNEFKSGSYLWFELLPLLPELSQLLHLVCSHRASRISPLDDMTVLKIIPVSWHRRWSIS